MKKEHSHNRSIERKGYKVIDCLGCGYWHVWPMPDDSEINKYYEETYFRGLKSNPSMSDKKSDPDGFYGLQYEDRLRRLNKFVKGLGGKRVLDIGAGYGDFLEFMASNGWEVAGIEPSKHAIDSGRAAKLNIMSASIKDLRSIKLGKFPVITLNNVLEHVIDPVEVLTAVKEKLLAEGGLLSVVVPNDFNVLQQMLSKICSEEIPEKTYYWVDPAEHLNYWSSISIKRLLEKIGFEVLYAASDFPVELFALMGENYIKDPAVGRTAHLRRVRFEKHLKDLGALDLKDGLFERFADLGIGRSVHIIARVKTDTERVS